jgi:DNA-directed RNA polymerase
MGQDVYTYKLEDLNEFLHQRRNDKSQIDIIKSKLDRKLIKSLFMPLIYGKTMNSIGNSIRSKYGDLLTIKESYNLAKLCTEFLTYKYPDILNFRKFILIISWFSSVMDRDVVYRIPYFTTKQDSMSFVKEDIWIYKGLPKRDERLL